MVIEDALQVLTKAGANQAIVTKDGKSIGSVELNKMIFAMARPNDKIGQLGTYR